MKNYERETQENKQDIKTHTNKINKQTNKQSIKKEQSSYRYNYNYVAFLTLTYYFQTISSCSRGVKRHISQSLRMLGQTTFPQQEIVIHFNCTREVKLYIKLTLLSQF